MIDGFGFYQSICLNVAAFIFIKVLFDESLDFKVADVIAEQAYFGIGVKVE